MKGYKVTNSTRSRIVGVAASSLNELIKKSCAKFEFTDHRGVNVQLLDGTFVDDEEYFQTLPQHTILYILKHGETAITGAEIFYQVLRSVNLDFLRAGNLSKQFLTTDLKSKIRKLSKLANDDTDKSTTLALLSAKEDDPSWFEGLDTRAKTKEDVMFHSAQDRIKNYMYKTQDVIKKSQYFTKNSKFREEASILLAEFSTALKTVKYHGDYFDRRASGGGDGQSGRLCDNTGKFVCHGRWDKKCCQYDGIAKHTINPYSSREARLVFQMWNLDHRIERSRTVIPAILEACQLAVKKGREVNWKYFYSLLFTTANLKLVHIICHDKGMHSIGCDPSKYLISENDLN